ncbi:hypothetical protein EI94DRAFT_1707014 [Lactarius quietus]|nr:hypothetical protein EI94DRAFT_1707014 [Lactarius quietus]
MNVPPAHQDTQYGYAPCSSFFTGPSQLRGEKRDAYSSVFMARRMGREAASYDRHRRSSYALCDRQFLTPYSPLEITLAPVHEDELKGAKSARANTDCLTRLRDLHALNYLPPPAWPTSEAGTGLTYLASGSASSYRIVGLAGTIPKRARIMNIADPGVHRGFAFRAIVGRRVHVRAAIVDPNNPGAWNGTLATAPATTVSCTNDAEVLDRLAGALDLREFIFAQPMRLADAFGWITPKADLAVDAEKQNLT